jgi:hypothetical protein
MVQSEREFYGMESAPRDGTPIIACDSNGISYEAYFHRFEEVDLESWVDWIIAGMNLEDRREQLGFWYTKEGRMTDQEFGGLGDSREYPVCWTPMPIPSNLSQFVPNFPLDSATDKPT